MQWWINKASFCRDFAKNKFIEAFGLQCVSTHLKSISSVIKALKYERKIAKAKADEAIDFVKAIECYAKFNKEDESAKTVYRQLNQRIKRVNDLADKINKQYENINNWISNRAIFLKRLEKLKEEKTEKVNWFSPFFIFFIEINL